MRRRASLTWGLVGSLSFLVLLQAYELVTGWRTPLTTKFGIAIGVGIGAAVIVHVVNPRLAAKNGRS